MWPQKDPKQDAERCQLYKQKAQAQQDDQCRLAAVYIRKEYIYADKGSRYWKAKHTKRCQQK